MLGAIIRTIIALLVAPCLLAAALVAPACSDGDGDDLLQPTATVAVTPSPEAEADAELSIEKSFANLNGGELRFTIIVSNVGSTAARDVTIKDVWQEGLVLTRLQQVDGENPQPISDRGLKLRVAELPPQARRRLVYDARCDTSGSWMNMAEVTAANLPEAVSRQTTVDCP